MATTGVAGPDPADGHPPGTVFVAVSGPRGSEVERREGANALTGDRAAVRWASVVLALQLLTRALQPD